MDIELVKNKIEDIIYTSTGKDVTTKYGYYIYKEYCKMADNKEVIIKIGVAEGNLYFFTKGEDFTGKLARGVRLVMPLDINKRRKRYYDVLKFTYDLEEANYICETLNDYFRVVKREGGEILGHLINNGNNPYIKRMLDVEVICKCLESNDDIAHILNTYEMLFPKIFSQNLDTEDLVISFNDYLNKNSIDYEIIFNKGVFTKRKVENNTNASINREKLKSYLINCMYKNIDFNKKYYVYRHYYTCPDTNKDITLYVGKGKGKRALISETRSEIWKKKICNIADKGIRIKVDIIRYFKNEKDALNLETALISYYSLIGECECNVSGKNLNLKQINSIVTKIGLI